MIMYQKELVDGMMAVAESRAMLKGLHAKIYDDIASEDDSEISRILDLLEKAVQSLKTIGVDVPEAEVPSYRKVTINEPRTT